MASKMLNARDGLQTGKEVQMDDDDDDGVDGGDGGGGGDSDADADGDDDDDDPPRACTLCLLAFAPACLARLVGLP